MVAEGVVDLLEAVEVHEQDADAAPGARAAAQGVVDAVEEERAVRQAGEVVVEGEPLVLLRLPAELPRRARDEPEDAEPEQEQAAADEGVRRPHVVGDGRLDRRVREVELERAEDPAGRAEAKRDDDLVDPPAPVAGRHAGRDPAVEGLTQATARPERVADRGPVVGVEDAAAAVPQLHARHSRGLQADQRAVERDEVALPEAVAELVRRQLRLERRGDHDRRLLRVRVRARAGLMLEVLRQAEAEQRDRQEAHERERREQAGPPAAGTQELPQGLTIFGRDG